MTVKEIYVYFEYSSLLIALMLYTKYKGYPFYKFFCFYLINVVLFGVIIKYFLPSILIKYNTFLNPKTIIKDIYNIYTFFEFNLIAVLYFKLIKRKEALNLIKYLAIIFNIIYFTSFFLLELKKHTVLIEAIVISVFIIIYFRELLNSKELLKYKKLLPFWVSVGFLIYYLTTIPFFAQVYFKLASNLGNFPIFHYIIITLHLCFIYGLIICKRENN